MLKLSSRFRHLMQLTAMLLTLVVDAVRFFRLCLRPRAALAAENLFLRKQLAMYQERQVKPQHATHGFCRKFPFRGHFGYDLPLSVTMIHGRERPW